MLKLADWDGLSYYMLNEIDFANHVVLVRDKAGKESQFVLETGTPIRSAYTKRPLDAFSQDKAREFIKASKKDFLEYWSDSHTLH